MGKIINIRRDINNERKWLINPNTLDNVTKISYTKKQIRI